MRSNGHHLKNLKASILWLSNFLWIANHIHASSCRKSIARFTLFTVVVTSHTRWRTSRSSAMRFKEPDCKFVSLTLKMHPILVASHTQSSNWYFFFFYSSILCWAEVYQDQFNIPWLGVREYEYHCASFQVVSDFAIPEWLGESWVRFRWRHRWRIFLLVPIQRIVWDISELSQAYIHF